jgi:hypothetical protein
VNDLRIAVAFRLAQDVDACEALLRGERVSAERLDPAGVAWAQQLKLVRLDERAIDLFAQQLHDLETADFVGPEPPENAA